MKHLVICEYGTFLGVRHNLLSISSKEKKAPKRHFPLNRLSTLSIAKKGVSFSSDLIEAFSLRGIKLFFLDFRGVAHSALVASHQHGVVAVRKAQIKSCDGGNLILARKIVYGKIRNQRSVLGHLNKYHKDANLFHAFDNLKSQAELAKKSTGINHLLGIEGFSVG